MMQKSIYKYFCHIFAQVKDLASPGLFEGQALDGGTIDFGHEVTLGHGAVFVRDGAVRYLFHVDLAAEHDTKVVFLLVLGQAGPE